MLVLPSSSYGSKQQLGAGGVTHCISDNELILKKKDWRYIRELAYFSSIGLQVALSILIGYWIGQYLDGKFDTEPWLTIVFFILGVAAAVRNLGLAIKKLRNF